MRYDPRELSDEELVARSHTELFHVTRAYEELMGLRRFQQVGKVSRGLWTNVQDHVVSGYIGDQLHSGRRAFREFLGDHHVHWQRHADFGGDGASGVQQVRLVQGFADRVTCSRQEGVGDTAADDQLVADLAQAVEHIKRGRDLGAGHDGSHRLGRGAERLAQRAKDFEALIETAAAWLMLASLKLLMRRLARG